MFKSLGISSRGASAAMKEIEILPNEDGVPEVTMHRDAKAAAAAKGICTIHISLSHSDVSFTSRSLEVLFSTLVPRLSPSPSLKLPLHEGFAHVLTFYNPLYNTLIAFSLYENCPAIDF